MIHVTGGTYIEDCREPHWHELVGSGLRAALGLRQLGVGVEFHTAVGDDYGPVLERKADDAGLRLNLTEIRHTIGFEYLHPLSKPGIELDGNVSTWGRKPVELYVEAENVLRFGIVEGNAKVKAHQAVYDPQAPNNPRSFSENGSTADRLAVIANKAEARRLTGETDAEKACRKLICDGAEVAVVKCGAAGCVVGTMTVMEWIPAFRTERVWPIGSGDVFTAIFAHGWIEEKLSPAEAARNASHGAAHYVETRTFPTKEEIKVNRAPLKLRERDKQKQVYLAGPFFNLPQRWLIEEFFLALRSAGVRVFSPVHDVGHGPAEKIYKSDIDGLKASGVVLACLDGLDPGTVYEVGFAQSMGLPVICFVTSEKQEDLKMFVGGQCKVVGDFATPLSRTIWAAVCE